MNQASAWTDISTKVFEIGRVAIADFNPAAVEDLRKESIAAAIKVVTRENLISGTQQARHCRNRGDAAGKAKGALRVFELRQLLFEHATRGISAPRVVVFPEAVCALLLEGRSLIDRRCHRTKWVLRTGIKIY